MKKIILWLLLFFSLVSYSLWYDFYYTSTSTKRLYNKDINSWDTSTWKLIIDWQVLWAYNFTIDWKKIFYNINNLFLYNSNLSWSSPYSLNNLNFYWNFPVLSPDWETLIYTDYRLKKKNINSLDTSPVQIGDEVASSYVFSPDWQYVYYLKKFGTSLFQIYKISINSVGWTWTPVSSSQYVKDFYLSSDWKYIVYSEFNLWENLYLIDLTSWSSVWVKINNDVSSSPIISPDWQYVYYLKKFWSSSPYYRVYKVSTIPTDLLSSQVVSSNATEFKLSPDWQYIVYSNSSDWNKLYKKDTSTSSDVWIKINNISSSNFKFFRPVNQTCTTKLLNYKYPFWKTLKDFVDDVSWLQYSSEYNNFYFYNNWESYTIQWFKLKFSWDTDYWNNRENIKNINNSWGLTISTFWSVSSPIEYTSFQWFVLTSIEWIDYFRLDSDDENLKYFYLYKHEDWKYSKLSDKKYLPNTNYYWEKSQPNKVYIWFETGLLSKDYIIKNIDFWELNVQYVEREVCIDNDTWDITIDWYSTTQDRLDELEDKKLMETDIEPSESSNLYDIFKQKISLYFSFFSLSFNKNDNVIPIFLPTWSNHLEFEEFELSIPKEWYSPQNNVVLWTSQDPNSMGYKIFHLLIVFFFLTLYVSVIFIIFKYIIFWFFLFLIWYILEISQILSFRLFWNENDFYYTWNPFSLILLVWFVLSIFSLITYLIWDYLDVFVLLVNWIRNILWNSMNYLYQTFFDNDLFYSIPSYIDTILRPVLLALFLFLITKKYWKIL